MLGSSLIQDAGNQRQFVLCYVITLHSHLLKFGCSSIRTAIDSEKHNPRNSNLAQQYVSFRLEGKIKREQLIRQGTITNIAIKQIEERFEEKGKQKADKEKIKTNKTIAFLIVLGVCSSCS